MGIELDVTLNENKKTLGCVFQYTKSIRKNNEDCSKTLLPPNGGGNTGDNGYVEVHPKYQEG